MYILTILTCPLKTYVVRLHNLTSMNISFTIDHKRLWGFFVIAKKRVFVFAGPRPFAWLPALVLAPNLYLPVLAPNLYLPSLAPSLHLPAMAPICIYQPWLRICIYRPWPTICITDPGHEFAFTLLLVAVAVVVVIVVVTSLEQIIPIYIYIYIYADFSNLRKTN